MNCDQGETGQRKSRTVCVNWSLQVARAQDLCITYETQDKLWKCMKSTCAGSSWHPTSRIWRFAAGSIMQHCRYVAWRRLRPLDVAKWTFQTPKVCAHAQGWNTITRRAWLANQKHIQKVIMRPMCDHLELLNMREHRGLFPKLAHHRENLQKTNFLASNSWSFVVSWWFDSSCLCKSPQVILFISRI